MKIVLVHQWPALTPHHIPIYVGGPVQGGGDWQESFISHFVSTSVNTWSDSFRKMMLPRIVFIVPCSWGKEHSLAHYFTDKYEIIDPICDDEFRKSIAEWLASSFNISIKGGMVVYGLFPENKKNKRKDGLQYACNTRFDLGLSLAAVMNDSDKHSLFVGKHKDFLGIEEMDLSFQVVVGKDWFEENTRYVRSPKELADWVASSLDHSSF